jgi:DNA polymerase III delta prime subunit
VLDWQSEDVPALPEPQRPLTVADVVDVDPRTAPHWLLIGSTGSGKTIASYAILRELARRAACQFIVTEPGGVNWGAQTTATNTADIARAILDVQSELERRQQLLRLEDVDHVQDLARPLPYIVLVAEETETVLDDLRLVDKDTRTACILALRSIARLGRKAGICLVAVTQAGTTDVFDAHVRKNMNNVLLFRSQHVTGETWRVSRDVRLAELPTGTAWSVMHNAVVQFPNVTRPALPQVQLQPLDAIPVDNWPTTASTTAVVDGCDGCSPVVQRLDPGREPDPQLAAQLRRLYANGWSKTRLCQECWGYKDGPTWAILDRVLSGEL